MACLTWQNPSALHSAWHVSVCTPTTPVDMIINRWLPTTSNAWLLLAPTSASVTLGVLTDPDMIMCRYASLFNSYVGLLSAAEDSRPLLLIGMGARGMGPLRAALEWTPVQAHATANPVTLFYITQCQQSAAYLADWDQWREAGVHCSE